MRWFIARSLLIAFLQLISVSRNSIFARASITYELSGGRFGDNLLSYLHAKWVSYKCDIPLLYRSFPYSSELIFEDVEKNFEKTKDTYFRTIRLDTKNPFPNPSLEILYICPYFSEILWDREKDCYFFFQIDWQDQIFRNLAKQSIAPKKKLPLIYPPASSVNIAIHYREGGGYDGNLLHLMHPLKIPPISFYVEALQKIVLDFEDFPIYCHVFTDALNPSLFVDQIYEIAPNLAKLNIQFRKTDNRHDQNVLEDFFSLFNFDILIRPESNFSLIPDLLSDFAIVATPVKYAIFEKVVTITESKFKKNDYAFKLIKQRTSK